jgi:hypothetical protein
MAQGSRHTTRYIAGSTPAFVLGILVFLCGVALLAFVFKLAYDTFAVPPSDVLGVRANQKFSFETAGQNLAKEIVKVLMLLVMAVIGSLIANRGVTLIVGSRSPVPKQRDANPTA